MKKLRVVTLAFILSVSLTACGSEDPTAGGLPDGQNSVSAQSPASAPAAASEPEPASTPAAAHEPEPSPPSLQKTPDRLTFDGAESAGPANYPEKTGTFDAGYIIFIAENGWYVNSILEGSARLSGDTFYVMQEGKSGVINISGTIDKVPKERVASLLASSTTNAAQLDNVTVNGIEYIVMELEHKGYFDYLYITTIGGFDESKSGTISILIQGFTPDEAKPLLETITIGDSF